MNRPMTLAQLGLRASSQTTSTSSLTSTTRVTSSVCRRSSIAQSHNQTRGLSLCVHQNGSLSIRDLGSSYSSVTRARVFFNASTIRLNPLRNASTATTSSSTISSSKGETSSQTATKLDWPTFFRLRKSRRRLSLISSISTGAITATSAGYAVTATPLSDTITSMSPLPDPIMTLVLSVLTSGAIGWLIGPVFGIGLWRLINRSAVPGFMVREKDFYERVKRYRVDPRGASAQNPVPDYYGEKVGSREEWRTWLKDQRAFNRKREGRGTGVGGGLGFAGKGL